MERVPDRSCRRVIKQCRCSTRIAITDGHCDYLKDYTDRATADACEMGIQIEVSQRRLRLLVRDLMLIDMRSIWPNHALGLISLT